jgi:hypothetical protein
MRFARALVIVCCVAGVAHAGPKVFVTRADSTASWDTRKQVEDLVVGLARNVDRNVSIGDATFNELATATGCAGGGEKCKGVILDSLAIDEIVGITIAPAGSDSVKVTVRRMSKAGATREATAIAKSADPAPAVVASIGPLFGAKRVIDPPKGAKQPPPANKGTVTTGGPIVVDNEDPLAKKTAKKPEPPPEPPKKEPEPPKPEPKAKVEPAKPEPKPEPKAEPKQTADATPAPAPTANTSEGRPRRQSLAIGGMAVGTAFVFTGVILWRRAGSVEDDIRAAPNRTQADIDRLLDLESKGDRYALLGNVLFVGGVAIAGASAYLFWRGRRTSSAHAHVTPMLLDRGGGIAVWGTR